MAKKLESSKANAKHMRNVPARQPQAQVSNQSNRVTFATYKKEGQKEETSMNDMSVPSFFKPETAT